MLTSPTRINSFNKNIDFNLYDKQAKLEEYFANKSYTSFVEKQEGIAYNEFANKFYKARFSNSPAGVEIIKAITLNLTPIVGDTFYTYIKGEAGKVIDSKWTFFDELLQFRLAKYLEKIESGKGAKKAEAALRDACAEVGAEIVFTCLSYMLNNIGQERQDIIFKIARSIESDTILKREEQLLSERGKQRLGHAVELLKKGKLLKKDFLRTKDRLATADGIKRSDMQITNFENITKIVMSIFDLIVSTTGLFETETSYEFEKDRKVMLLKATDQYEVLKSKALDVMGTNAISETIMIVPPNKWTGKYTDNAYLTKKMGYKSSFVKLNSKKLWVEFQKEAGSMSSVFEAINLLQETPYKINMPILEAAKAIFEAGGGRLGIPLREREKLEEVFDLNAFDKVREECVEGKRNWKEFYKLQEKLEAIKAQIYDNQLVSDFINFNKTIEIAEILGENNAFYIPLNVDSRGRMYCLSKDLNYQRDDLNKGLIKFANTKKIGKKGHIWLAILGGANNYEKFEGVDLSKVNFDKRYEFVLDNEEAILACAEDPFQCDFWKNAENPFQFLAFCFEWKAWVDSGRSEDFETSYICYVDGTCNGLQHWSALLKDENLAELVNVKATAEPGDIYQKMADKAFDQILVDIERVYECAEDILSLYAEGEISFELFKILIQQIQALEAYLLFELGANRKVFKTPVMTSTYGVTPRGAKDQILKALKDVIIKLADQDEVVLSAIKDQRLWNMLAKYYTDTLRGVLAVEMPSLTYGMEYLKVLAEFLAKSYPYLTWSTPDGFKVFQKYNKTEEKKINTLLTGVLKINGKDVERLYETNLETLKQFMPDFKVKEKKELDILNERSFLNQKSEIEESNIGKHVNAISANFVHSLDATHARKTALKAYDAYGIEDFAFVHDSFGTHASSIPSLSKAIRETFHELYAETDLLGDFFDKVCMNLEDEVVLNLKETLLKKFEDKEGVMDAQTFKLKKGKLNLEEVLKSNYFFA